MVPRRVEKRREKGEGRREKGEGRREKGEGRREKGEGRREGWIRDARRAADGARFAGATSQEFISRGEMLRGRMGGALGPDAAL